MSDDIPIWADWRPKIIRDGNRITITNEVGYVKAEVCNEPGKRGVAFDIWCPTEEQIGFTILRLSEAKALGKWLTRRTRREQRRNFINRLIGRGPV